MRGVLNRGYGTLELMQYEKHLLEQQKPLRCLGLRARQVLEILLERTLQLSQISRPLGEKGGGWNRKPQTKITDDLGPRLICARKVWR